MISNEDHTHENFNAPVKESSQRAAESQIKVDVIEAEPEATAKRFVARQRFIESRMDLCKLISEQSEVH